MTMIELMTGTGRRKEEWDCNMNAKKNDQLEFKKGSLNSILLQFRSKIGVVRT